MLKKYPNSSIRSSNPFVVGFKALLAFELALLGGSYYVWRKLYNQQEFRYKVHQKYPTLLKLFYRATDRIDELPGRMKRNDYEKWGIHEN